MPSAIELSLKHGVAAVKVRAIAADLDCELDEANFELDEYFHRAAYDIRRQRISAFALAYYLSLLLDDKGEIADMLCALTNDGAVALNKAFVAVGRQTIERDKLAGAQIWLDRASDPASKDVEAFEHLAQWCKSVLDRSEGEKDYNFLAVRLLLSLPEKQRLTYPKTIQGALNRVKHYGYLAGYFSMENDAKGKTKTIYHRPKNFVDL